MSRLHLLVLFQPSLSFAPLLANPGQPWKQAVFMVENESSQMVRNRKYSYLEFQKGPVPAALYDLEKDPWETVNLADDPAYAKARQEMADALKAGWKAALPPRAVSIIREISGVSFQLAVLPSTASWKLTPRGNRTVISRTLVNKL